MSEMPVLEHGDKRLPRSKVILDYLIKRFGRRGWNDNDERRAKSPRRATPTLVFCYGKLCGYGRAWIGNLGTTYPDFPMRPLQNAPFGRRGDYTHPT